MAVSEKDKSSDGSATPRQVWRRLQTNKLSLINISFKLSIQDPDDNSFGVDDDSETVDSMLEAIANQAEVGTWLDLVYVHDGSKSKAAQW